MTATHNPQKRIRPWKPTPRDQAIYRAVVIGGRTQAEAGADFGRSQSAVSRLLRRFERWRGGTKPEDSGDLDPVRQAHLDRWLARQRQDEIYQRSMRLATKMEEAPAKTHREGARDGKEWHEDTERDQLAAAAQMLKTALRASEALDKLADKPPLPALPGADSPVDYEQLMADLTKLRQEAEETGHVPKSRTKTTADIWLRALVGHGQEWYLAHHDSDSEALLGLVKSVRSSRIGLDKAMHHAGAAGVGEDPNPLAGGQESKVGSQELETESPPDLLPGTEYSVPSTESPSARPADHERLTTDMPPTPTHKRIGDIDQYYVELPAEGRRAKADPATTSAAPRSWSQPLIMEPLGGESRGSYASPPYKTYGDDPLGRLYQRIEDRMRDEAAARRWAGG